MELSCPGLVSGFKHGAPFSWGPNQHLCYCCDTEGMKPVGFNQENPFLREADIIWGYGEASVDQCFLVPACCHRSHTTLLNWQSWPLPFPMILCFLQPLLNICHCCYIQLQAVCWSYILILPTCQQRIREKLLPLHPKRDYMDHVSKCL